MDRNVAKWPNVEERHPVFYVGEARYTAIPVKANLPDLKIPGADCLVTVLSAQAADLEDEHWLNNCLQAFREMKEDVWTYDFLDGLIISFPKFFGLASVIGSGGENNRSDHLACHRPRPGYAGQYECETSQTCVLGIDNK